CSGSSRSHGMRDGKCLSRRNFMYLAGATAAGAGPVLAGADDPKGGKSQAAAGADDVLHALLQGNERFVRGQLKNPRRRPEDFSKLAEGQNPVAAIVGCADSRVPPEL